MDAAAVRSACERFVTAAAECDARGWGLWQQQHDGLLLARAWLAEHPPDSADPPTPDRLRAAGFGEERDGRLAYGTGPLTLLYFHATDNWPIVFVLENGDDNDTELPDLPTMAEVRKWMAAVDAANGTPAPPPAGAREGGGA